MPRLKRILYSKKIAPYVFVLPFIISFLIFWISPLASTVVMSFQNILPGQVEFIGWRNYERLFIDKVFHQAIKNSFIYMFLTLVLLIPFPMIYAYILDSRLIRAQNLWKTLLYLPALTSVVVAGTLFRLMFSESPQGQANQILMSLGLEPIKWLKGQGTGYFALLLLACWRWTGVNMLYFMSGLNSIDNELYEVADIDGANTVQKFIHIAIPLIKPTTIYVITISIYAGLAMFLESFMIWGGNSSPNNIGTTIVGYLYRRGIERNQLGYASAVGLVLFLMALVINVGQLIATGTLRRGRENV